MPVRWRRDPVELMLKPSVVQPVETGRTALCARARLPIRPHPESTERVAPAVVEAILGRVARRRVHLCQCTRVEVQQMDPAAESNDRAASVCGQRTRPEHVRKCPRTEWRPRTRRPAERRPVEVRPVQGALIRRPHRSLLDPASAALQHSQDADECRVSVSATARRMSRLNAPSRAGVSALCASGRSRWM